jgi:hypothetical protein
MKNAFTFCLILALFGFTKFATAQCTPDHTGYATVPDSGKLLPTPLPHAILGTQYTQVITIGIPGHAQGYAVNWIKFNHMKNYMTNQIDSNTWTIVNSVGTQVWNQWSPLTWQCITLSGTPNKAGTDSLVIYVDANVTVIIIPVTQPNVKAFTIPLIVDDYTGMSDNAPKTTSLIKSRPNPFQNNTQIGLSAERSEKATLSVYTYMGQLVYSEDKIVNPGENYFTFDGSSLAAGTYLYTVTTSGNMYREKLVKTE